MSQITLLKLQDQLKNFGLNPTEWTLEKVQALQFMIVNKSDENFALRGRLEYRDKAAFWKSLEVVSL